ncbi:uncharacterized protein [Littorina saxatilis]|uniref:uncharacterized protein n=1 Tax=Littorina saxatilis TaxID=31220 RepID=UPI0038B60A5C
MWCCLPVISTIITAFFKLNIFSVLFRYYTCERVRELKYHPVRPSSPYCYLSANVFASMRMKTSYTVWVMVTSKKEGSSGGGGEIKEAFCSCPAGLLGSCNHIAGVLFRVEAAVKIGATQRTGTEVSCQWAVPKGPVSRKQAQAAELQEDKLRADLEGLLGNVVPDIAHTSPCVDNLQYNKQDSCTGVVSLKEKHGYYGQIQGQLAIAGGSFCELFVFTLHGHMLVRLEE